MLNMKSALIYFLLVLQHTPFPILSPSEFICREIFRAIADADFEELEALRDSDAEFNCFDSEGLTPVMRASQADLDKFVRLMHKAGANLNTRSDNEDKSTALHFCAISGATKTIRMLIQLGADPKVLDENGQTPCSLAKTAEHLPAAKFLAIATGETTPEVS